jgi:hypothetical protein
MLRSLEEQASDFVAACDRFNQAVVGGTAEKESAVFHQGLFKHKPRPLRSTKNIKRRFGVGA